MRLAKNILFALLFITNLSCDRNAYKDANRNEDHNLVKQSQVPSKNVQDTNEVESNQEVADSIQVDEKETQYETVPQKSSFENSDSNNGSNSNKSVYDWWMLATIATLVLICLLLWGLIVSINQKSRLKAGKEYYKNRSNDLEKELRLIKGKNRNLTQKKQKSQDRYGPKRNDGIKDKQFSNPTTSEDEKPVEVSLSVNNLTDNSPREEIKQSMVLYAEKATENNTFSAISEQKNDHKSIFKLLLEDKNSGTAQFEVLDTEFILKMAANSPDTYLYTVCKPDNSNQNFAGEIETLKKGIAHKVEGKWHVKDENKAIIKFQ